MKKKLILLPLVGLLCYVVLPGYKAGPGASSLGDLTGASGGTIGCASGPCHGFSSTPSTTVGVQLYNSTKTAIVTSYVGGTSYHIRVTGVNTSSTITNLTHFGFQVSVVKDATTTNAGTLSFITGTHLGTYSGINIVEHSAAMPATSGSGGTGTTYVVDIPWVAPIAGTGTVRVWTVLNAVNFNGGQDPGDLWNNTNFAIPEASTIPPITGTLTACVTTATTLSNATPGGTWSSGTTSVATVGSMSGTVIGVAPGTSTITYTATAGTATATVTIITTPAPGAILGSTVTCIAKTTTLSNALTGGTWSSSATAIATVGSSSGIVAGVALGTATISYKVTNACGSSTVTHTVTIKATSVCAAGTSTIAAPTGTELSVYPNPNTGIFTLNLVSEDNTPAHVVITNIVGATVQEFTTQTNKPMDVKIDRPAGMYVVTARTASGVYVTRVMVE